MGEKPKDIKEILADAMGKATADDRAAYLDAACGSDAVLRGEIESLLKMEEQVGDFLEVPALDGGVTLDESPLSEGPGTVIGRYKLLERIGEGGMAVVYMAEQAQPIRRKVALKIIKLGMDTKQVIARFEAERQALAMMDHPNIAKVLDAGATETGRPYFVMELVTGVSITEYCDANNLSTKDRLALFVQVCQAVQHAHQKGIIHRDIKPSNVMVAHLDGRPVPKVIDFGIAKATNQKLTEKTLFTRYAHIIGTPAYMSPEQAELSDMDIDTRTDIYSLGVLLYELLTGTTPFSEEELRKAGYIEMQRVIREQEPARPSTKLSTLGDTLTDVAKHRGCTPDLLSRAVRGDLDWIVMKSLEKDRARRYETANALGVDVQRHIDSEPVLARGPGAAYRVERFLRRHRSQAIAALAMLVAAVAVVVVLSMWNRDRLQLAEAEGFRHRGILSQAREQYAKADREAALATIRPILASKHVGPEAQLLRAGILVDNRRPEEAVTVLEDLLDDQPEVAGAAHSLLARILWESASPDADRLQEIEAHRQKAEALLPETAEAYFLRAMTAITLKEQLTSLDRALQLDPGHYESRRLRAFTYYASRKYERMKDDAMVMTVIRPRDPLGHSLHAIAWRELGSYSEAIADYDRAMSLTPKESPQYIDLSIHRCETLLWMGDYTRVVAEAQECLALWPERSIFQYHIFYALTAAGKYGEGDAVFRQIVGPRQGSRSQFENLCTRHVFDTLEAGRAWHPQDREPSGAAFLPMIEAEDTYRQLSAKGRRITTDGFSAEWSPDGSKLAFSMGVHGYSGVAVFEPDTKETDLLIVPGKDPRWSPDGKYIAFVRDCQFLRVQEFIAAERKNQDRALADEEIWIMKSDGMEPRRLTRGSSPSWGKDSTCVYYQSHADKALCSISVAGMDADPKRLVPCSSALPSVSPDGQRVAYMEGGALKVKDLASQAVIAEWPVPFNTTGRSAWSPTGNEVCLGGRHDSGDAMGLWIYSLDRSEPLRILGGHITTASWSLNGTKLVFILGSPHFDIWAADLDPNASMIEALGPGQTMEQYLRERVAFYSRRIETDGQDAYVYYERARYYNYLNEQTKANADMRRWSVLMLGESPSDSWFATRGGLRHVIHGPFDCQLVLSVERRAYGTEVLCVAFGQKGRCEMKSFEIPMVLVSLVGFCFLSSPSTPAAHADFTFGEPVNLGPLVNSSSGDTVDSLSADGLEMYLTSNRPGGQGAWDIWVATRETIDDDWGAPVNLGPLVNSGSQDWCPFISADGLELYLTSGRSGGHGSLDIWVTRRATEDDAWGRPENLGPLVNSSDWDGTPWLSSDGLELYFYSLNRAGGYGGIDIWISRRATKNDPWGEPANLGPVVNSSAHETSPFLSSDGLLLFFGEEILTPFRSGGLGGSDMWMSRRASISDPWGTPVNLGPIVNSPSHDCGPRLSPDGSMLYFCSERPGGFGGMYGDIYQAPIIPIVDFNADGLTDSRDVSILLEHRGHHDSLCDIGPTPFGDGIVDIQDLRVLAEYVTVQDVVTEHTPSLHAVEVARDVVLRWLPANSADTHDVYLGTSFEDVDAADRANPLGVLVSQDQSASTFDASGLLEFGQTYYWRIDEVSATFEPTIHKGFVVSFTTEALAYPLDPASASASTAESGAGPENTINGSGLNSHDEHSTAAADMWLASGSGGDPVWIQYEFDQIYKLHEMWAWNYNVQFELVLGFGLKDVTVEYSENGTDWTVLGDAELAQATAAATYTANTTIDLSGVAAKYVRLTVNSGWGVMGKFGLSEVRFLHIPTRAREPQPADGETGVSPDTMLSWRAGREAVAHDVYLSTDRQAVVDGTALVDTVTEDSYQPGSLDPSQTYYWKVNEINEGETISVWEGDVWEFATAE